MEQRPADWHRCVPNRHTLLEIAEEAVVATANDPLGGLDFDDIYGLLDVGGTQNEHLANPLNRDPTVYHHRPRAMPLVGDEQINGRYLSLTYCGHYPLVHLCDHEDLHSLERSILSDSGILNPFVTYLIAFIDFRNVPYRVVYRGGDGSLIPFTKLTQYDASYRSREQYIDRQLEWQVPKGT